MPGARSTHSSAEPFAGQAGLLHLPPEHSEMQRGVLVLLGPSMFGPRVYFYGHYREESCKPPRRHDGFEYTNGESTCCENSPDGVRLFGAKGVLGDRTACHVGCSLFALFRLVPQREPCNERPECGEYGQVVACTQHVSRLYSQVPS